MVAPSSINRSIFLILKGRVEFSNGVADFISSSFAHYLLRYSSIVAAHTTKASHPHLRKESSSATDFSGELHRGLQSGTPIEPGQAYAKEDCLLDAYNLLKSPDKKSLQCTANDVRIASASLKDTSPTKCIEGEYVTYDAVYKVKVGSKLRYDITFRFAEEGGDALIDDACTFVAMPTGLAPEDNGNKCGEGAQNEEYDIDVSDVKVLCRPSEDNPDLLGVEYCAGWSQRADELVCDTVGSAIVGTGSKCRCESLQVPIKVCRLPIFALLNPTNSCNQNTKQNDVLLQVDSVIDPSKYNCKWEIFKGGSLVATKESCGDYGTYSGAAGSYDVKLTVAQSDFITTDTCDSVAVQSFVIHPELTMDVSVSDHCSTDSNGQANGVAYAYSYSVDGGSDSSRSSYIITTPTGKAPNSEIIPNGETSITVSVKDPVTTCVASDTKPVSPLSPLSIAVSADANECDSNFDYKITAPTGLSGSYTTAYSYTVFGSSPVPVVALSGTAIPLPDGVSGPVSVTVSATVTDGTYTHFSGAACTMTKSASTIVYDPLEIIIGSMSDDDCQDGSLGDLSAYDIPYSISGGDALNYAVSYSLDGGNSYTSSSGSPIPADLLSVTGSSCGSGSLKVKLEDGGRCAAATDELSFALESKLSFTPSA